MARDFRVADYQQAALLEPDTDRTFNVDGVGFEVVPALTESAAPYLLALSVPPDHEDDDAMRGFVASAIDFVAESVTTPALFLATVGGLVVDLDTAAALLADLTALVCDLLMPTGEAGAVAPKAAALLPDLRSDVERAEDDGFVSPFAGRDATSLDQLRTIARKGGAEIA